MENYTQELPYFPMELYEGINLREKIGNLKEKIAGSKEKISKVSNRISLYAKKYTLLLPFSLGMLNYALGLESMRRYPSNPSGDYLTVIGSLIMIGTIYLAFLDEIFKK